MANENRSEIVYSRFTPEEKRRLMRAATKASMSQSRFVQQCVVRVLDEMGVQAPKPVRS